VRGSELAVLAEGLRANETVEIAGPFGGFVLDDASARPLLFVAEGVGYAPIKGLLQHALSRDRAPSIVLHWFGGAEGLYQEALPRSYAAALDEFRYVPVSNPAAEASAAALATLAGAPELSQTEVYAAGSPEFLASLRALLASVGLPDAHYHEEPTAG
jgi:CDP-4-dehydro-6-deoxyglucose reductase